MTRKECLEILELSERATLSDIKRSYRRLAFALHPDLNPGVKDSAKRFQRLNEAYVLLSQDKTARNEARTKTTNAGAESQETQRARQEAGKAYSRARDRFDKDQSGATRGNTDGEDNKGNSASSSNGGGFSYKKQSAPETKGREDVLKDILDDPFARRVFEDIYSHLHHNAANSKQAPTVKHLKSKVQSSAKASKSSSMGLASSLAGGMFDGVKGWFQRKIDEDQTIAMPGESLLPGARVRIKISHGLSGKLQTVELTLPPEFVPGKPVRLKGLGKKVGSLRGDLYLTLIPKAD